MSIKSEILREIRSITTSLVEKSIIIDQNWPSEKNGEIVWDNYKGLAFSLQNEPYETIFDQCRKERDFNFMLIDGSLIQLQYRIKGNNLIEHILRFLPNPSFEKYQDNPEEFEELYYGIELFTNILDKKTIVFPIRFDFSNIHKEILHPKVHATFGNYKDCRIPISKPISPKRFVSFILRNFYNYKFIDSGIESQLISSIVFEEDIADNEKKLIHLAYD